MPLYHNDDETNECEPSPQPNSNVLRLDHFCKQVLLILHVINEKEATAATRFIKTPYRSSEKAIYYRDHIIGMFAGQKIALVQTRPGRFCEQLTWKRHFKVSQRHSTLSELVYAMLMIVKSIDLVMSLYFSSDSYLTSEILNLVVIRL